MKLAMKPWIICIELVSMFEMVGEVGSGIEIPLPAQTIFVLAWLFLY
jgi:hypothetical protein